MSSFNESKNKLSELNSIILQLNGRYNEIERQKSTLEKDRKKSLDIIDMIPKANSVINALYDRIAGDMVKLCENAITDASHEIINDNTDIGMEVYTERGQIAVNIGSSIAIDENNRILRSIVDGEGGGLTNVVCFSLRSIIVSRSGQRKFMVIDEPDCWLDNGKINPFFNVIYRMATLGGYQIIALTHHDTSNFEDSVNILTITRDEDHHSHLSISGFQTPMENENIIESIRLKNFGGHEDITFPLCPGLNFIRGMSNVGKSRLLRALRCVILGEGNDGDISTFKTLKNNRIITDVHKKCSVQITFDQGKVLTWTRKRSGSPKEVWSLQNKDGEIATLSDGTLCENNANGALWAGSSEVLNIKPLHKLCAQLHTQKLPMFAINENGRTIASLLSIGKDAGILREMLSMAKAEDNEAKAAIKQIDRSLENCGKELLSLSFLNNLQTHYNNLKNIQDSLDEQNDTIHTITQLIEEYKILQKRKDNCKKIIQNIPEPIELIDTKNIFNLYSEYLLNKNKVYKLNNIQETIQNIGEAPDIIDTESIFELFEEFYSLLEKKEHNVNFQHLINNIQLPESNLKELHSLYVEYKNNEKKICHMKHFLNIIPPTITIDKQVKDVSALIEEYMDCYDTLDAMEIEQEKIEKQKIEEQKVNDDLKLKLGQCPTCGQTLPHHHKGTHS